MFSIELKILISFAWALIVFLVVALIIGPERKAQWFQRRKKYSFFNRRGFISEHLFFGYPKTKEGIFITAGMVTAIGAVILGLNNLIHFLKLRSLLINLVNIELLKRS